MVSKPGEILEAKGKKEEFELLDTRLFAHIHSDNRLTGSHLEGNTFEKTCTYVLRMLNNIPQDALGISSETIQEILKTAGSHFQLLIEFEQAIIKTKEKLIKTYAYGNYSQVSVPSIKIVEDTVIKPISQKIYQALEKRNKVLIPGGWTGYPDKTGHAMCYQLTVNKEDGSYTLLIFNTGSGIEYHAKYSNLRNQYSPVMAFHIPKSKNIQDKIEYLITVLLSPCILPVCDEVRDLKSEVWEKYRKYSGSRLYQELISKVLQLGATPLEPEEFTKMKTQGQLSGTCTMRVLKPILNILLKAEAYQQFMYQLEVRSLLEYFSNQQRIAKLNDSIVHHQLSKACFRIANRTKRLLERYRDGKSIITIGVAKTTLEHVAKIQKILQSIIVDYGNKEENPVRISILADGKTIAEDLIMAHDLNHVSSLPKKNEENKEVKDNQERKEYQALHKKEMPKQAEQKTLLDFLGATYETLRNNDSLDLSASILNDTEFFFLNVPLDYQKAKAFWSQIPLEHSREALNYLQGIIRLYGKHCYKTQSIAHPKTAITSYTAAFSGQFILNQFYRQKLGSEWMELAILPNYFKDLKSMRCFTLDPRYDFRVEALQKLQEQFSKNQDKIKAQYSDIENYYDLIFLKNHNKGKTLSDVNAYVSNLCLYNRDFRGADEHETARMGLYAIQNNQIYQGIYGELRRDYDLFWQVGELSDECNTFNAFSMKESNRFMHEPRELDHSALRQAKNHCYFFERGREETIGKYRSKYQFVHTFTREFDVYDEPSPDLAALFKISEDDQLYPILFNSMTDGNQRIKRDMAGLRNPSFTRQLEHEMRIIVTKDFFESNLNLLSRTSYQVLLLSNLLFAPFLKKQIERTPGILSHYIALIQRGFNYHFQQQDTSEGQVFCFELSYFLLRYLKNFNQDSSLKESKEIISSIQIAIQTLEEFNSSLLVKIEQYEEKNKKINLESAKKYQKLILLFFLNKVLEPTRPSPYSLQELKLLYKAILLSNLSKDNNTPILTFEMTRAIAELEPRLAMQFSKLANKTKEFIKELLKDFLVPTFLKPNQNYELSIQYPKVQILVENQKNPILFDLSKGTLTSAQTVLSEMSSAFYQHPHFKRFFGENSAIPSYVKNYQEAKNLCCEFDYWGMLFKLSIPYAYPGRLSNTLNIQRKIPGESEWFQFETETPPTSENFYEPGIETWKRLPKNTDQIPTWYCTRQLNIPLCKIELHPIVNESSSNANANVAIAPEVASKPLYGYRTLKLNEGWKLNGYTLLRQGNATEALFSHFEDPRYIEVWKAKASLAHPHLASQYIRLPRYGLEWSVDLVAEGPQEFVWLKHKDFILSSRDPKLIDFRHCLCMKNKKTSEIIYLIPKQEFYPLGTDKYHREYYKLAYDLNNHILHKRYEKEERVTALKWYTSNSEEYCQYTLSSNNTLIGNNNVANLQLAYIYLAKHQPERAIILLRHCHKTGGLKGSLEEVDLIRKIMLEIPNKDYNPTLFNTTQVRNPETEAVRLYAAFLLSEQQQITLHKPLDFSLDALEFSKSPETLNALAKDEYRKKGVAFYKTDFKKELSSNYEHYYKRLGNIPVALQLNPEALASLFRTMGTEARLISPSLNNQWQELTVILAKKEQHKFKKQEAQKEMQKQALDPEQVAYLKIIEEQLKVGHKIRSADKIVSHKSSMTLPESFVPATKYLLDHWGFDKSFAKQRTEVVIEPISSPLALFSARNAESILVSLPGFYKMIRDVKSTKENKEQAENIKILREFIENSLKTEVLLIEKTSTQNDMLMLFRCFIYVLGNPEYNWLPTLDSSSLGKIYDDCYRLSQRKPITLEFLSRSTVQEKHAFLVNETFPSLPLSLILLEKQKDQDEKQRIRFNSIAEEFSLTELTDSLAKASKVDKRIAFDVTSSQVQKQSFDSKQQDEFFIQQQKKTAAEDLKEGAWLNHLRINTQACYKHYLTPSNLKVLFRKISSELKITSETLNSLRNNLLKNANAVLQKTREVEVKKEGDREDLLRQAAVMGEMKTLLSLEELIYLYLEDDLELLQSKTELNREHLLVLHNEIHDFLSFAISKDQNKKRALEILQEMETQKQDSEAYQNNIIKLGEELTRKPLIEPLHPEIQVFQYLDNKSLRAEQFEFLKLLIEPNNSIAQMIMGGGKSKVLMPLLALKRAKGNNLSILEVPEALFKTNLSDLQMTTQKLFGKSGYPFVFHRDSDCRDTVLKDLYQQFKSIIRERNYLVTTASSIQALQLKYLELTHQSLKAVTLCQQRQIEQLENILRLLKTAGDVLVDECDTVLDPKHELNYTHGKAQSVPSDILLNILKLFDLLKDVKITIPDLNIDANLNQVMLGKVVLTSDSHWEMAWNAFAEQLVENLNSPIFKIAGTFNVEHRKTLMQYLLNNGALQVEPDFILKMTKEQLGMINLAKGQLELFKIIFKRKQNEHYGFPISADFSGSREIAIPYICNNKPREDSQFGLIYEIINYTIKAQKERGVLSISAVQEFVQNFYMLAQEEIASAHGKLTLDETKASLEFEKITKIQLRALNLTDIYDAGQYSEIREKFSRVEAIFNEVLLRTILPKIQYYPSVLCSNPINHHAQFRTLAGITGTPIYAKCQHYRTQFDSQKFLGIDGQIIDLLKRKQPNIRVIQSKDRPAKKIIEEIIIHNSRVQDIHSLIDVGALFKGLPNLKVAEALAQQLAVRELNTLKHILYFNEIDQLCALPIIRNQLVEQSVSPILIGSTLPEIIFEKTGSKPEQYFIYFDQAHTTGIDIQQPPYAHGVLSIDHDNLIRDFAQGSTRLRGLANNQTLEIILVEAAKQHFKNQALNMNTLIEFLQNNQNQKLSDYHFKAALANMQNLVREDLLQKIFNTKDIHEKIRLRSKFSEVFDNSTTLNPLEDFNGLNVIEKTADILNRHGVQLLAKWKSLLQKSDITISPESVANMQRLFLKIQRQTLKICKASYQEPTFQQENTVEVQLEQSRANEREHEREREKEQERLIQGMKENSIPLPYIPWKDIFPFPRQDGNLNAPSRLSINSLNNRVSTKFKYPTPFSDDILVSENYSNPFQGMYNTFLKPLNFFLAIKNNIGKLKFLLICQEEAQEFLHYIDNNKEFIKKEGYKLCLVSPHNTVLEGDPSLLHDLSYTSMLEQVQFFSGNIDLLLKNIDNHKNWDWLFESMAEQFNYMEAEILPHNPEQRKFFPVLKEKLIKIQDEYLSKINNVDYKTLFEAIQKGNQETFIQELLILEKSLENLPRVITRKMFTDTQGGQKESLLQLSLQSQNKVLLDRILKSTLLGRAPIKLIPHPFIQALRQDNKTIFESLLSDSRFHPSATYESRKIWQEVLEVALQKADQNVLRPLFSLARSTLSQNELAWIAHGLIRKPELGTENSDEIRFCLDFLSPYWKDSDSLYVNIWHHYIQSLLPKMVEKQAFPPILQTWAKAPPTPWVGEYLNGKNNFLIFDLMRFQNDYSTSEVEKKKVEDFLFKLLSKPGFLSSKQNNRDWALRLSRASYDLLYFKKIIEIMNKIDKDLLHCIIKTEKELIKEILIHSFETINTPEDMERVLNQMDPILKLYPALLGYAEGWFSLLKARLSKVVFNEKKEEVLWLSSQKFYSLIICNPTQDKTAEYFYERIMFLENPKTKKAQEELLNSIDSKQDKLLGYQLIRKFIDNRQWLFFESLLQKGFSLIEPDRAEDKANDQYIRLALDWAIINKKTEIVAQLISLTRNRKAWQENQYIELLDTAIKNQDIKNLKMILQFISENFDTLSQNISNKIEVLIRNYFKNNMKQQSILDMLTPLFDFVVNKSKPGEMYNELVFDAIYCKNIDAFIFLFRQSPSLTLESLNNSKYNKDYFKGCFEDEKISKEILKICWGGQKLPQQLEGLGAYYQASITTDNLVAFKYLTQIERMLEQNLDKKTDFENEEIKEKLEFLKQCIQHNSEKIFSDVLETEMRGTVPDDYFYPLLEIASKLEKLTLFKTLMEKLIQKSDMPSKLLRECLYNDNLNLARQLFKYGLKVENVDSKERADSKRYFDNFSSSSDIGLRGYFPSLSGVQYEAPKQDPLIFEAVLYQKPDWVKLLLDQGIPPTVCTLEGTSLSDYALQQLPKPISSPVEYATVEEFLASLELSEGQGLQPTELTNESELSPAQKIVDFIEEAMKKVKPTSK
jgi:hypothetical protein